MGRLIKRSESRRRNLRSNLKVFSVIIILVVATSLIYLGQVGSLLGSPSPTITRVVTPGSIGPCTWFVSLDGSTPVAEAMVGGLSVSPGDNIVGSTGQDMGAFMNAITVANTKYCFSNQVFTYTTQWTVISGISITGSYNSTVFKAGANSMSIIAFPNAGQSTNPRTTNVDVEYLTFDSTGKTGVVGVNFNESINENSNHIRLNELHFLGTGWSYIVIGDGNEDSIVSNIYSDIFVTGVQTGCGDVSWKTYTGTAYLYNIIYGEITGCNGSSRVHVIGNLLLKDSVLGGISLECQTGSQTGSGGTVNCGGGQMDFDGDWFCNGSGQPVIWVPKAGQNIAINEIDLSNAVICVPANTGVIEVNATGAQLGVTTMRLKYSDIVIASVSTSALFYSSAGGGGHIIFNNGVAFEGNHCTCGAPAVWAYTAGAVGSIQVSQWHFSNNFMNGNPNKGDWVGQGNGNYYLSTEPAGFGQSTPGWAGSPPLPAGTGSGNQQADGLGWPERIMWSNSTNVGAHIIDSLGSDKLLLGQQNTAVLYPAEHIYFATALPTAWLWEGLQW